MLNFEQSQAIVQKNNIGLFVCTQQIPRWNHVYQFELQINYIAYVGVADTNPLKNNNFEYLNELL